ncbi:MAG: lipid-A-disaccharide synthase [Verrucomicrobia bacterium]|nr:lipid-A-disaccharide synthase [Verrucomicrobiota bacterium]MCH8510069.1 lipid-A-disaccharide synthase [Kiritimatiellia bacterium]
MNKAPDLLIVAGELSGDQHAARILRSMKQLRPGLTARGFGGDHLAAEGMELRQHTRDLAVMGIAEVLRRYGFFRRIFHELLQEVRENPPDLILFVDYPGFNLRFAKAIRGLGIPAVHYICPQVWAWKQSRIPKMAQVLDRLICIFPFEPPIFEGTGLPAFYCGHPLVEETLAVEADTDWGDGPKLALLPGSRTQEITRLFPPMVEAAERLRKTVPNLQVRVAAADESLAAWMRDWLGQNPEVTPPELVVGKTRALVKGADAALVTSGTATLETALLGTPMLVVYKTSALTYAVGKRVVKVKYIGMVNLVAGREVCPEFIQDRAEPENLAKAMAPLLRDSVERKEMMKGLSEVRGKLLSDEGGAKPAECVLELLKSSS